MATPLRVLCIHGIAHQEADPDFRSSWTAAINAATQAAGAAEPPEIDFLDYDDLFEHTPLNALTYATAVATLLKSYITQPIEDLVGGTRGLLDVPQQIRWTAGMVAQWSTEPDLRAATRAALTRKLRSQPFDIVCAHSLGSLIAYDTFSRDGSVIDGLRFATLGSQIGNPAVRDVFAGRIQTVPAKEWYHLYNSSDHVFTYPLSIAADNFQQVDTPFDIPNDILNHDATWYLKHQQTINTLWRDAVGARALVPLRAAVRGFARVTHAPTRRALLIGINNYPNPANRLEGCVNDVFLMSSVLQESTFDASEIRVVLDERATTDAIMERLHWLLDDVRDGDRRVLFYSGHGARIPEYGPDGKPEHYSESLVPYDFDWSPKHAITDRQFCELYSQLPYASNFVGIFDCCHSGGLTRDGGPKIRGISPPDDVRHRALRWDAAEQMWVARDFKPLNRDIAAASYGRSYLGDDGATYRLGRAASLRTLPNVEFNRTRTRLDHYGPYLPVLMEACREEQFSFEYRHGATSYGAYTYSLAEVLRENRAGGRNPDFNQLSAQVGAKLTRLRYDQNPVLVGPKGVLDEPIPWSRAVKAAKRRAAKRSARRSRHS
jgi:hypothetical protein